MIFETPIDRILEKMRSGEVESRVPRGGVVCGIGCGVNGFFLKRISGKIRKGIGIDKKVAEKDFGNIKFRKMLVTDRIPAKDEEFDCVTLIAVLKHLERPKETLNEIRRILNKSGSVILTTPSPMSKPLLEFLAELRIINLEEIRDHKHYYSKEEIEKLLKECGFKDTKVTSFQFGFNTIAVARK